jgi:hypothetical protein
LGKILNCDIEFRIDESIALLKAKGAAPTNGKKKLSKI